MWRKTERMAPTHRLPWSWPVHRDDFLVSRCAGRRVLHLACASSPFTRELHASHQLLHHKLRASARQLIGVDIDEDALEYLRTRGFDHLHHANLLDNGDVRRLRNDLPWQPDVVLAGELIEHLDQPVAALRNFAQLLSATSELILTVPNAFSAKSFLRVLAGREKVARDHVAYFSLTNLRELAARSEMRIEVVRWYRSSFAAHRVERVVDCLLWPALAFRPQVADGIIVVCKRAGGSTVRDVQHGEAPLAL